MTAFAELDRLFDPAHPCLTREGARMLAEMRPGEDSSAAMEELARKANEGRLTEAESRQYESWVRAGTLISILQAKARLFLKQTANQQ